MRKRGKIDANQSAIVAALRKLGASVQSLASIGAGCPDIAVGWSGVNHFFEIKDGNQPPSKQKLTPDEVEWAANWKGRVVKVNCLSDILLELNS